MIDCSCVHRLYCDHTMKKEYNDPAPTHPHRCRELQRRPCRHSGPGPMVPPNTGQLDPARPLRHCGPGRRRHHRDQRICQMAQTPNPPRIREKRGRPSSPGRHGGRPSTQIQRDGPCLRRPDLRGKVSQLAGQGLPTTVYSHTEDLSKRLKFAATNTITSITTTTDLPIRRSIK